MSESNRVRVLYVEESVFGTTPTTPTMKEVRRTGGRLEGSLQTVASNEVNAAALRSGVYLTGKEVSGNIEAELSYESFDDLIEAALRGTWDPITTTEALTVVSGTKTVTMTGAFTDLVVGDWIKISGSAGGLNNGFWQIVTRAGANEVTVANGANTMTSESATAGATIASTVLKTGTEERSFSIEQGHLDTDAYFLAKGCRIGEFNLSVPAQGLVTCAFSFQGKSLGYAATSAANTVTAANTNGVYNSTSNFYDFLEGGADPADDLMSLSLTMNTNLRRRNVLGSVESQGIKYGTGDVTGSLEWYANGTTVAAKVWAYTQSGASWRVTIAGTGTYVFYVPKLHFTGGAVPDPAGLDGDVTLSTPFTAFRDPSFGGAIGVYKFA